jgi:hypothetical protein
MGSGSVGSARAAGEHPVRASYGPPRIRGKIEGKKQPQVEVRETLVMSVVIEPNVQDGRRPPCPVSWRALRASATIPERSLSNCDNLPSCLKCPASKCPTEPLRPQKVRASSIASSNGHDRPTAPSAQSKATTDLNRGSGAPPIRELETTTPEAAFAMWPGN